MPPAKLYPYLKTQPTSERPFVFVDYSAIDSGLTAPDDPRSFGVLTGTSNLADWENLNEEEYKTAKESTKQFTAKKKVTLLYPRSHIYA